MVCSRSHRKPIQKMAEVLELVQQRETYLGWKTCGRLCPVTHDGSREGL